MNLSQRQKVVAGVVVVGVLLVVGFRFQIRIGGR